MQELCDGDQPPISPELIRRALAIDHATGLGLKDIGSIEPIVQQYFQNGGVLIHVNWTDGGKN
jgi:hypothetical protein